jgi:hypothetical protein
VISGTFFAIILRTTLYDIFKPIINFAAYLCAYATQ